MTEDDAKERLRGLLTTDESIEEIREKARERGLEDALDDLLDEEGVAMGVDETIKKNSDPDEL